MRSPRHLHSPTRSLEFRLQDHKDEWLAARLEDLGYGYIDGIEARDDLDCPQLWRTLGAGCRPGPWSEMR